MLPGSALHAPFLLTTRCIFRPGLSTRREWRVVCVVSNPADDASPRGGPRLRAALPCRYDKRAKKEKERALNAARVNAYRKLQRKLGDRLAPAPQLPEDEEEEEQGGQGPVAAPAGAAQRGAALAAAEQHGQDSQSEGEEQGQRRQDERQQERRQERQHQQRGAGGKGRGGGRGRGGRGRDGGRGRGGPAGGMQHKPQSHLQRIAAEVQERKVGAAAKACWLCGVRGPRQQAVQAAGGERGTVRMAV